MYLSAPQDVFLNGLNTKFRAYVGGFGCVSPDTKIWTEHGLKRISDLSEPVRVLSWSERDQEFQLSLSGGAFPKGKASLYRVVTQQGEFVASGHHRSLCADGKYRRVDSLVVGGALSSCDRSQLETISESGLLSLPSNAQHCSKTNAGLMGRYADEARRHGQQLLQGEGRDQSFETSLADVQLFCRSVYLFGRQVLERLRTRLDQLFYHLSKSRYQHLSEPLAYVSEGQTASLWPARTSGYRQESQLSLTISADHHKAQQSFSVSRSRYNNSLSKTTVIIESIEQLDPEEEYWDLQVLDTNNYVSEDGVVHHNSGKTFVGCLDLLIFLARHPGTVQGYFGPTYPSIRDIFYPTFEEAANMMGFRCDIKESNKEIHVYRGRSYYGTIICRSMEKPNTIVGFKISRALVDEIDVLDAKKAENAWNKIVARLRLVIDGVVNGIGVTTTPEGFKFVYNKFANNPTKSYSMVQASTYENADNLPPDYIQSLFETYPKELISAYISGEFVNLTSGTVYKSFDRSVHYSDETIRPGEDLFIGMDFNVMKQAATVYVKRDGGKVWHAVDELVDMYDTPDAIRIIDERFKGHKIHIYPDASGKNRKSVDASKSDISLLEQAGYSVRANNANPAVKDRVNAVNAAIEHGKVKINVKKCPTVAGCLEQQVWGDDGSPDKKAGNDHQNDATGYPIVYEFPINRPLITAPIRFNF